MCGGKIQVIESNSTSWDHTWRDGFAKRELRSELTVIEATIRVGIAVVVSNVRYPRLGSSRSVCEISTWWFPVLLNPGQELHQPA
ncbi:hypothetical protein F3Y22_tig00116959pilonHSYRG00506 [Hibiscus syriacus]|uniref:Uncharacterized protein n=1 Tax=Hibiscus syriacus TaxID=106335 RepID=A0A6A2WK43_HIBSY|nr:hypothetical protein F3Y22_tig00116959pilonHSYRG00506 [Hibiscus syriacus]